MIDSHAHIASEQFDSDRDQLISLGQASGLIWIEVGTNLEESKKAVALAEKHLNIFASVGVHPDDIISLQEEDWVTLEQLAMHKKVCAIGEVGFDTYRTGSILDQEPVLRRFIALAQKTSKPTIFHVRSGNGVDAHKELIRVLQDFSDADRPKGVIHTFSGTMAQAQEYIALGMMISFSGVITFKNAGDLREITKSIPLNSMLVETDCPFLTPEPFRGKRNEPSYVKYVIQKIADIRGVPFEEIERSTEDNAKKIFALDF
ncbi:MAG TPA: TatD family hydrolase [Candidatus Andersenbacteria bacterium]|nr:TatD family hydrolase [Candidatus Andersenbacteria bacterium]